MNIDRELLIRLVRGSSDATLGRVAVAVSLVNANWLIDVFVQEARESGVGWSDLAEVLEPSAGLGGLGVPAEAFPSEAPVPSSAVDVPQRHVRSHDGKYRALWEYLGGVTDSEVQMSFAEIEQVLGFPLPPSSRDHLPHWYGYKGSAVARAIIDAGWKAQNVDLAAETVTFVRGTGRRYVTFQVSEGWRP